MKKILSMVMALAMVMTMLGGLSLMGSAAEMTAPTLGDGTSGNVLVWNLTGREYTDAWRATEMDDKSILFKNDDGVAVGNEVVWNGYAERPGFQISYPTWNDMPLGDYYFKILFKTQKSNDEAVAKKGDSPYAASIRLLNGTNADNAETKDFGLVDQAKDGQWQCAVIPFTVSGSGQGGVEMAFYNNWQGTYFDFFVSQYAVISFDSTPLVSEYEDEDPIVAPSIGGLMKKPVKGADGVIQWWDICNNRGNGIVKSPNNTFYSLGEAETVWGKQLDTDVETPIAKADFNTTLTIGTNYYIKFLMRVDYPNDTSKESIGTRETDYYGDYLMFRDWYENNYGAGGGGDASVTSYNRDGGASTYGAGIWQSVVIEITHQGFTTDKDGNPIGEMAFFNIFKGTDIRTYLGQYMTLESDPTPLAIPYTDGEYEKPARQVLTSTAKQWWDMGKHGKNTPWKQAEDNTIYSRASNETFYGMQLDNGEKGDGWKGDSNVTYGDTYYIKFLVKVEKPEDATKAAIDDIVLDEPVSRELDEEGTPDGAYARVRDICGNMHRFAMNPEDGVWQSIVVDFKYTTLSLNNDGNPAGEIAFWNVYAGNNIKVHYGGIVEISDDPTAIPIPEKWIVEPSVTPEEVIAAIDALTPADEVTEDDRDAIEAARALYEKLSADDKLLVTNYDDLVACEEALPEPLRMAGDADGNGKINATDATTILRNLFWTGTKRPTINESNADVDDNGKVNATDATTILRHLFWTGSKQPPLL
jgi:hypothetical protein